MVRRMGAVCLALMAGCSGEVRPLDEMSEFRVRPLPGADAPVSLTATDGTGLALRSFEAKVALEPPLAFTQIELAFQNPEPRRLEGRLELALPDNATLSRLALQIGDSYQEGEVAPRAHANAAYEEALHARRDPALLERDAGNEYRIRVFPIEARETKRVIISYSQVIDGAEGYVLPLAGLPQIDRVRVELGRVAASGGARAPERRVFERRGWQPRGDLVVALPAPVANRALVHDDLALLQVPPAAECRPAPFERLTLLFDPSASAAAGFERRM